MDSIARLEARGIVPHPFEHWIQAERARGHNFDAMTYWTFWKPPSGPRERGGRMSSRRTADASAMLRCFGDVGMGRGEGGGMGQHADALVMHRCRQPT